MGWKKQARKNKKQSTTFDLLEKRHHVQSYIKGKIPPKEYVESALWKAWKTSPSKIMPWLTKFLCMVLNIIKKKN